MSDASKDQGLVQVLAQRLETQRLPRILSLKDKMDQGETLNDFDIRFLEEIFEDAERLRPLVERHPEWHSLAAKILQLYNEITTRALENEKAKGDGS